MQKMHYLFIKLEKKYYRMLNNFDLKIKEYNSKNYKALIADRGNPRVITESALLAKILNEEFKINISVVSDFGYKSKSKKLYAALGIKNFHNVFQIISLCKKLLLFIKANVYLFKLIILFCRGKFNFNSFINNYQYLGVKVGDIIYDSYVRHYNKYLNPTIFDYLFVKIFLLTILKMEIIHSIVKQKKVKIIIGSSKAYNNVSNLLLRFASKLNKKAILMNGQFIKFFNKSEDNANYLWNVNYNNIPNKKKYFKKKKIDLFFYKRFYYNKKIGDFVPYNTLKKLYGKNTIKDFNSIYKIFKIDNPRSIYINCLALHCFSDSPTVIGKFIFRDYYDQFIKTLEFLKFNNPSNIYWLIKPHPHSSRYGEMNIVSDVLKKYNLPFVKICPKNINNILLFKNINNLYTGRSTIGLEYACFGKKPVICGVSHYSSNNITINPKNCDEYFRLLINSKINNKLNYRQKLRAVKILYYLEVHLHKTFKQNSLILPENKNNNFYYYEKKLKKNMKFNNITNITDELYYSLLKKKVLSNFKLNA
jgi:hypothetical protein